MIISEQIDHAKFQAYCKKCTDNQLRFIIKDCREVLDAWGKFHPNEGKYLDQTNYAASELHRRNGNKKLYTKLADTMPAGW